MPDGRREGSNQHQAKYRKSTIENHFGKGLENVPPRTSESNAARALSVNPRKASRSCFDLGRPPGFPLWPGSNLAISPNLRFECFQCFRRQWSKVWIFRSFKRAFHNAADERIGLVKQIDPITIPHELEIRDRVHAAFPAMVSKIARTRSRPRT
jgi:hypothetical protein